VVEPARGGLLTLLARGAISDVAGAHGTVAVRTASAIDEVTAALAAGSHHCVVLDLRGQPELVSGTLARVRSHAPRTPVLAHGRSAADKARFAALLARVEPAEFCESPGELRERIAWHVSALRGQGRPGPGGLAGSGGLAGTGELAGTGGLAGAARHAPLRGKKILVVDDDPRNVFAITSTLEHYGMRVISAAEGRAGVKRLRAEPDTDLVLMDLMMPGMDGYAAISAIRDIPEFSDVPIIAVTAHTMTGEIAKGIPGADACLTKPLDTDELLGRMARCLSGSR